MRGWTLIACLWVASAGAAQAPAEGAGTDEGGAASAGAPGAGEAPADEGGAPDAPGSDEAPPAPTEATDVPAEVAPASDEGAPEGEGAAGAEPGVETGDPAPPEALEDAWGATAEEEAAPEEDAWGDEGAAGAGDLAELSLEELLAIEIVESSSRREQSIHDAASAVTLISREAIATMGVLDVPELLRRVPGAVVFRTAANSYRVALRDPATLVSNRVPVLLDGRPVGDGITNLTPFQWLPITVDDLERVEVIRGPGSTLYGANAQGGVVSLRSRRPLEALGFSGRLAGGLGYLPPDGGDGAVLHSFGLGNLAYGVANEARTFGARASFAYGLTPEWVRPEGSEPFRRGQNRYHTRLTLQWAPSDDAEVLLLASHADTELASLTSGEPSSSVFRFREQSWGVRGRKNDVLPGFDLTVAYDTTYLRMDTNEFGDASQWQHGLRLQSDLELWGGRSRSTLALEFARLDVTRLEPVEPVVTTYSLVLQEELGLIAERLLVNAALRLDLTRYDDRDGVELTYRNANPRVSLIAKPAPNHDLRLTAATGYRIANPIEVSSGVSRPAPSPDDPPIPFVVANPQLLPEAVRTLELGWRGDLIERLRGEVVAFLQETRRTVLVTSESSLPLFYENTETVNHIGLSFDLRFAPTDRFAAYGHYRWMRSRGDQSGERKELWPVHVGGLGLDGELGRGVRLHADFYFVARIAQQDLGAIEGTPIITSGFVRSPNIYDANLTLSRSVVDERVRIFATVRNIAAFFRDRDDLRQGLPGFSTPIGATILVGVELEPTG